MKDPYKELGVARTANDGEIKRAYRSLAKQFHPDFHPGDDAIADRFKELSAAYTLLSNPAKRMRFDRGEIDAYGNPRNANDIPGDDGEEAPPTAEHRQSDERRYEPNTGTRPKFAFGRDRDDILNDLMKKMRRPGDGAAQPPPQAPPTATLARGADRRIPVSIPFQDAFNGTSRLVELMEGVRERVVIPPGVVDGEIIRLSGLGEPSTAGGRPGDALIEIRVEPHPIFQRRGDDLMVDLAITLGEAAFGGRVRVPTLEGPVDIDIPAWTNGGNLLRLKGKGMPRASGEGRGDQLVAVRIMMPPRPDADLAAALKDWSETHPYTVR